MIQSERSNAPLVLRLDSFGKSLPVKFNNRCNGGMNLAGPVRLSPSRISIIFHVGDENVLPTLNKPGAEPRVQLQLFSCLDILLDLALRVMSLLQTIVQGLSGKTWKETSDPTASAAIQASC